MQYASDVCMCLFVHCSEVNSGFYYKTPEEREKLVAAERKFVDDRVMQVIALKKKVIYCSVSFSSDMQHVLQSSRWYNLCITCRSAMALVKGLLSSIKRYGWMCVFIRMCVF